MATKQLKPKDVKSTEVKTKVKVAPKTKVDKASTETALKIKAPAKDATPVKTSAKGQTLLCLRTLT
jgi:hypothetical protein